MKKDVVKMFDLRKFREENLKMTQKELATALGLRQDEISRMEQNPEKISLEKLALIADKLGVRFDNLINFKSRKRSELKMENKWQNMNFMRETLVEYLENEFFQKREQVKGIEEYKSEIDELKKVINTITTKPKVAFVGRSDVGKSTMINTLLGEGRLPARWAPTTAIKIIVKHINDRPDFIKDDVWIFKADGDSVWDDTKLRDKEYCELLKLSGGNFALLEDYGTRNGEKFDFNTASSAVAFVESPILLNCDLVDLPGISTGESRDDEKTRNATIKAKDSVDITIFLSPVLGFISETDMEFIREILHSLPTMSEHSDENKFENLFIVATQAHIVDEGKVGLDGIIEGRYKDLLNYLQNESQISEDNKYKNLRKRFFTYTKNEPELRREFEENFVQVIEKVCMIREERAERYIKEHKQEKYEKYENKASMYIDMMANRESYKRSYGERKKGEYDRERNFNAKKSEIKQKIKEYKSDSAKAVESKYRVIINKEYIQNELKSKKFKKKKEEIQKYASDLSERMQKKIERVTEEKTNLFSKDVEVFLDDFQKYANNFENNFETEVKIPFDVKRAFATGLTGAATFGALAFWASTCGNLGGYILIAKGVSLLSALGISLGGTSTVITAISAIGGPVTIGIVLAILSALSIFAIFSGGWQAKVAKKIVEEYEKADALAKYKGIIETYWSETETAFEIASKNLNDEWKNDLSKLKDLAYATEKHILEDGAGAAQYMRYFYSNLPCSE